MAKRISKAALKRALRPVARRLAKTGAGLPPSLWKLEHQAGRGLCLEGLPLHALLEELGSPLHVVHAAKLQENLDAFLSEQGGPVPYVIGYSYKTNPVAGVLRLLHQRGVWAEVISAYELWLALHLGVPPEQIIYNGPAKSEASVEEAIRRGIHLINLNSADELEPTVRLAQKLQKRPRVGLRVSPAGGWAGQFGVPIQGGKALEAFTRAKTIGSLELVGLHAHAGGTLRTAERVSHFLGQILAFLDELDRRLGWQPQVLDVGGSLAIPTVTGFTAAQQRMAESLRVPPPAPAWESSLTIQDYVRLVTRTVRGHFERVGRPPPKLVFEPGRALTGNTQLLLTRVMALNQSREPVHAILDAGINLAEAVRHEYHQLFPVNRYGEAAARTYALAGPICSPGDLTYPAAELPELKVGDSLAIMDAGAYLVPFSTSFSFPQPAIALVENGKARLIRRAETFEDLQRREL